MEYRYGDKQGELLFVGGKDREGGIQLRVGDVNYGDKHIEHMGRFNLGIVEKGTVDQIIANFCNADSEEKRHIQEQLIGILCLDDTSYMN